MFIESSCALVVFLKWCGSKCFFFKPLRASSVKTRIKINIGLKLRPCMYIVDDIYDILCGAFRTVHTSVVTGRSVGRLTTYQLLTRAHQLTDASDWSSNEKRNRSALIHVKSGVQNQMNRYCMLIAYVSILCPK